MRLALAAARRMAAALPAALAGSLLGFMWLPYFTWALTPSDLGLVGLTLFLARMLGFVATLQAGRTLRAEVARRGDEARLSLRNAAITLAGANFTAIVAVFAALAWAVPTYSLVFVLAPLLAIVRFPAELYGLNETRIEQSRLLRMVASGRTLLGVVGMVVLISGFGMSWEGRVLALIAADLVLAAVCWFVVSDTARKYRPAMGRGVLPLFLLAGAPLVARSAGPVLLDNFDRLFALAAFPLAVVGYYVAACRVARLVLSINGALSASLAPLLHGLAGDPARRRSLVALHTGFAALGLTLAAGGALLFYRYADIILGPRFQDAAPIIALVILAAGCHAAFQAGWLVRGFYPLTPWSGLKPYAALAVQVAVTLALLPALGTLAPAAGDVAGRLAASGIMTWAAFSCVGRLPIAAAGRARAGVEPRDDDL